jgi:hypothetical protein
MSRITIVVLFFLCVAWAQVAQAAAGTIVSGAGPRGVDMNTALAVEVNAPVDFMCAFSPKPGKKAFVMYRLVSNQWKPVRSCNNGAGNETGASLAADNQDPRRLITGWYEQNAVWKQCDVRGWKRDGKAPYLTCLMPDGSSSTFACIKGRCAKP